MRICKVDDPVPGHGIFNHLLVFLVHREMTGGPFLRRPCHEVKCTCQLTLRAVKFRKKKGVSVMVAAGLCSVVDGVGHVFPPHIIPLETKINAARYQDMLPSCSIRGRRTFCGC